MQKKNLFNKNIVELKKILLSLLKEQFNLRLQVSAKKLKSSHLIRIVRRKIARVKTFLKQKVYLKNDK